MGIIYGALTTLLTLIFIYFSWNVYKEKLGAEPILFKYSILYLFLLFLIMPIDKYFYNGKVNENNKKNDKLYIAINNKPNNIYYIKYIYYIFY